VNPAFAHRYAEFERWHWWFRGRRKILESVVRHEFTARTPLAIASLGCGPAEGLSWLVPLAAAGGRVVGVDSEPSHATALPPGVRSVVARIEAVPLRSGSLDVVLALDVFEHIPDDAAGLREAARLLRPGGRLIVTVPALESLWGNQDEVSHHLRRYSKATLWRAFDRAGLPRPRITYFNSLLFPAIAAVRWLRRGLGADEPARSDFEDTAPGLANDVLAALFAAERHLVSRVPLPIGVSLLAILRVP
jgi:SAM-dependent methyltransferase